MDQTGDFLIWFIAQSQNLGVEQKLTRFPESPELFHYTVKSFNYEPVVSGHACSELVSEAKIKAIVEFTERLNLRLSYTGSTSVGFACHFDPQKAAENAYRELLERDSFLWHWHFQVPPQPLESNVSASKELNLYLLQSRDPKLKTVLCLLKNTQGLYFVGLGTHVDLKLAKTKSLMEAFSGFYNFEINHLTPISLGEFKKIPRVIPRHHFELSLSSQYIEFITQWTAMKNPLHIPPLPKIEIQECDWHPSLEGNGLKMFRATSEELLKFYFGLPDLPEAPNQLPHPMA